MVRRGPTPQGQKSYEPSEGLVRFIEEKLELLKQVESSREWDSKKVYYVDKMFQSLADLIYFLESLANNSELREVFEKDLEELLDVRPYNKTRGLPSNVGVSTGIFLTETNLTRLVYASIIPHQKEFKNFRLKLLTNLQLLVYEKMHYIMQEEYGMMNQISKSIFEDMNRCLGWVTMLSKPKEFQKENPNRIIHFKAPYKIR